MNKNTFKLNFQVKIDNNRIDTDKAYKYICDISKDIDDKAEKVDEYVGDIAEYIGDIAEYIGDIAEYIGDKAVYIGDVPEVCYNVVVGDGILEDGDDIELP